MTQLDLVTERHSMIEDMGPNRLRGNAAVAVDLDPADYFRLLGEPLRACE